MERERKKRAASRQQREKGGGARGIPRRKCDQAARPVIGPRPLMRRGARLRKKVEGTPAKTPECSMVPSQMSYFKVLWFVLAQLAAPLCPIRCILSAFCSPPATQPALCLHHFLSHGGGDISLSHHAILIPLSSSASSTSRRSDNLVPCSHAPRLVWLTLPPMQSYPVPRLCLFRLLSACAHISFSNIANIGKGS